MPIDSPAHRLLPHLRRIARVRAEDTGDGPLLGAFVVSRDEDAFAALVRRHGPMVLGVCRRVIGDVHLAEDAFQATFLVLARRAAVVRPRHLVGPWLYGVAYRTALKARGTAVRRQAKEKQVDAMPHPAVPAADMWADLQPVLDAELARLPEKFRIPVVLCDLNGRPQRDVARELNLSATTLTRRLASARRLLARRLTDRGMVLSAGAVASALGWHAATSAVSPALAASTIKAACAAAAGTAVGLPVPVVQLSEGVMRMFVLQKLKTVATGAAVGLVLLVGLGVFAGPTVRADPEPKPPAAEKAPPAKPADPVPTPESEDAEYFRKTSLDLRSMLPTHLEMSYFLADADAKKRAKIVEWMLPGHASQKVTATCQTCHATPPTLSDTFSKLNKLFGKGEGWKSELRSADLDRDGWRDRFVTERLTEKASPELEALRAEEERAKATVLLAETELREVDRLVQLKALSAGGDVERARAKHKAAQAAVEAAGLRRLVVEKEQTNLSRSNATAAQIAGDMDRLILERLLGAGDAKSQPTDAEFLRRLLLDVTGLPPTTIEMKYFMADTDPKKREKLLKMVMAPKKAANAREKVVEELLADPYVQKRWAELYQQKLYAEQIQAAYEALMKAPDRLDRLLGELMSGKKTDEQILEALCLATVARFPTETERRVVLDGVKAQPDRSAAWVGVLKALAATAEAKAHAEGLAKRGGR